MVCAMGMCTQFLPSKVAAMGRFDSLSPLLLLPTAAAAAAAAALLPDLGYLLAHRRRAAEAALLLHHPSRPGKVGDVAHPRFDPVALFLQEQQTAAQTR